MGSKTSLFRTTMLLAVGIWIWAAPSDGRACSVHPQAEHMLDHEEKQNDTSPPSTPGISHISVSRGKPEPLRLGCVDDCGTGGGAIDLQVLAAADDRTPPDEMGYRLELVGGDLPEPNGSLPSYDVRARGGVIKLIWFDGESVEQDPFEFSLVIYAVDLGGNVSAPSEPILIEHPGVSGGCRTVWVTPLGFPILVLGLLLLALRRREPA